MPNYQICMLIGTRPNFMKVVSLFRLLDSDPNVHVTLLHTGQHFDANMSDVFMSQFGLKPKFLSYLTYNANNSASRLGSLILELGHFLEKHKPNLLVVVGDVDSTLAGFITAIKLNIQVAHIESGLRSGDLCMPEEVNRILVDRLSDFLFVSEPSGITNLKKENCTGKVYLVGNTMIDSISLFNEQIEKSTILSDLGIRERGYCVMTFHRPSNLVSVNKLILITKLVEELSEYFHVVFPLHPRTLHAFEENKIRLDSISNVSILQPMNYFDFQCLIKNSAFITTDSGGIQEETTYYGVPCFTIRQSTERPITLDLGTNVLMDLSKETGHQILKSIKATNREKPPTIQLWDGQASNRIYEILKSEIINA